MSVYERAKTRVREDSVLCVCVCGMHHGYFHFGIVVDVDTEWRKEGVLVEW